MAARGQRELLWCLPALVALAACSGASESRRLPSPCQLTSAFRGWWPAEPAARRTAAWGSAVRGVRWCSGRKLISGGWRRVGVPARGGVLFFAPTTTSDGRESRGEKPSRSRAPPSDDRTRPPKPPSLPHLRPLQNQRPARRPGSSRSPGRRLLEFAPRWRVARPEPSYSPSPFWPHHANTSWF